LIRGSLNSCPFGLPITKGCKCAGGIAKGTEVSAMSLMTPIESDLEGQDEIIKDNLEALSQVEEGVVCPYADSIYKNGKVDCKFDINNQGIVSHQLPLNGSPEYPSIMIGNSSTPGFSYPTHEYSDNNNRSIYYGIYSLIG
jgi:hypothetical protein